ncbi:MAG: hypothetical protein GY730_10655 [bacterium]|nr:hypothetical protein [bacterium]
MVFSGTQTIYFKKEDIYVGDKRLLISFYRFLNELEDQVRVFELLGNKKKIKIKLSKCICIKAEAGFNNFILKNRYSISSRIINHIKKIFLSQGYVIDQIYAGNRKYNEAPVFASAGRIIMSFILFCTIACILIFDNRIRHQTNLISFQKDRIQKLIGMEEKKEAEYERNVKESLSFFKQYSELSNMPFYIKEMKIDSNNIKVEGYLQTSNTEVFIRSLQNFEKENDFKNRNNSFLEVRKGLIKCVAYFQL